MGEDVGYGWGWKLLAGSVTPIWASGKLSYYSFVDSTGAQYRLDQNTDGIWTSLESVYVSFNPSTNKLYFRDGSFWFMGCTSASSEEDAGTLYPTTLEDTNGNQIYITYHAGMGLTGSNTSARITLIQDVRGTYTFTYSNSDRAHLISITNNVGTSEAYTFTYSYIEPLKAPFSPYTSYSTVYGLSTVVFTTTSQQHSFTYSSDNSGALASAVLPNGGALTWSYQNVTYGNGATFREISQRQLSANGSTYTTYPFTYGSSPGNTTNQYTSINDPGGVGQKYWAFSQSRANTGMVTQYQGNQLPGPVTKTQNNFTWSQDSVGNLHISSTLTTLDPGQTYSVQKRTDQNVDIYGNVLNVFQYDYGNLTTPSRIYTYTYLNSSAYTSLNIYNRMLSATVGVGQQNVITLASNAYDNNYVSPAPSGITNWDTSYATATARGNLTSFTSINNSGLTYYDQTGMPTSSNQNNVATTITGSASNNYAVPSQITVGSLTSSLNWSSFLGVTSATGPNGDAATISYDTSARPSTSTSPYGATTSYVYSTGPYTSSNPNTTTATTNSHWTKTILDGLGRTITVQTGTGSTTLSQVDTVYGSCGCSPTGKMIQQSLPHAPGGTPAWTTYTYDGIGRTVSVVAPDGASTTSYLYQGNTVRVTDPAGKFKTFTMDAFGHLTMVDEPSPGSTPPPAPVFPPTFSPAPGTYGASQTMTINSATSGATIRYTTDGSTPTETHGTVYSGSFAVSANTSINAIAYETGMSDSAVSAVSYTINSGTTAQIAFDAQSTNFTANTNSFSFNHTVGTNSNRILVCGVLVNTANPGNGISGITYAGASMTLVAATSTTYDPKTYWWLANPTSGTNSVTVSGAGVYYNVYTSCASYSGASQTAPTNFTTSSQSSPITFTLTTSQNNDWLSAFFQNATGDTPSAGTGTTIRTSPNNGGGIADSGGPISPAGAASLHFTADGTLTGIIVDLVPATGGGGSYPTPVAIPTTSAAPGTYGASQAVTLSSTTPSASIYYTTNGTTPSSSNGLLYSGSISVTATTTIQAIAYATGMATSEISTGAFTILPPSGGGDYLTYYTYDAWDNLSTVSMPRPSGTQTRTFTYNGKLLMSATNPENGTVSYTYNGYNKLATKTDAKGQSFSYTYDTYARLIGVSVGSTQVETYTYDTNQNSTYPNYSQGRLTSVQYLASGHIGASFLETYGYSIAGLRTNKGLQITQTLTEQGSDNNNHTGPGTADLESVYTYDTEGRMTNIQYAGNSYNYGYDSMERLNTMTNANNSQQIITGTTYDPANRLLSISGELTENRTYNGMGQLTNITSGWGGTPSLNITYNYSSTQNNGKITSQSDAISGEQIQYTYDSLNRLGTATASGTSSPWGQSYTYDGFGNLLDQIVTAGSAPSLSVNYTDTTNRQSTDCADANGNIIAYTGCGGTILYGYDYKNRISTVFNAGGGETFYTYSPDNKRVFRSAVDIYNNPTLSEVAFWSVTGQKLFTCNLAPGLAVYQPSSQTWKETLSCTVAVTNTYFGGKLLSNGTGSVVQDRLGSIGKYYPWGQVKPSGNVVGTEGFTGYYRDAETTLDYAINRYHQPGMGRFLSVDQANANPGDPATWNRYGYSGGDPVNNFDPSGMYTQAQCEQNPQSCQGPPPGTGPGFGCTGGIHQMNTRALARRTEMRGVGYNRAAAQRCGNNSSRW